MNNLIDELKELINKLFYSSISKESIIDVEAEVVKVSEKIESCTQQNIELHVHQVGPESVKEMVERFTQQNIELHQVDDQSVLLSKKLNYTR